MVQPFVPTTSMTPEQKFGANSLLTLTEAKKKSIKPGSPADMLRRNILAAGSSGPLTKNKHVIGLRELARISGYGSNHMRLKGIHEAKQWSKTIEELLEADSVKGKFKPRKDKIAGDPIWREAWHHFMSVKKGQSYRCKIVRTARVKDPVTGKWVHHTQWERHQKRFMSMVMADFRKAVIQWEPYLKWRETYLANNMHVPRDWHVGESRLYKEKCFCIDEEEQIRKCGCEYHLKMHEPLRENFFSPMTSRSYQASPLRRS